jgi:hypothetical protein
MFRALASAVMLAALATPALAQLPEDTAKQAAQEVRTLVTEGTAVIGDLQPAINSGKVDKDQVAPDALVKQFHARYTKAAGAPLDIKASGRDGRRAPRLRDGVHLGRDPLPGQPHQGWPGRVRAGVLSARRS